MALCIGSQPISARAQSLPPPVTIRTFTIDSGPYLHHSTGKGIQVFTSYLPEPPPTNTTHFRAEFELLDDANLPMVLSNAEVVGGTFVASPVVVLGSLVILAPIVFKSLIPEQTLDPSRLYRVRMRVVYACPQFSTCQST